MKPGSTRFSTKYFRSNEFSTKKSVQNFFIIKFLLLRFIQLKITSFDGETVRQEPSSTYLHTSSTLGKYRGLPFAVGGMTSLSDAHGLTEVFNSSWTTLPEFPFVKKSYHLYSTVSMQDAVYFFGKKTYIKDN